MKILFLSTFFASIIFLLIDIIWLSYSVKNFYRPNLENLLNDKPVFWAAIFFYLLYMFGLLILVIKPALDNNSVSQAFWLGLVFGLIAYGTYNLTNMATIKGWSEKVVFIDMIWGAALTSLSSSLGILIAKRIIS